MVYHGRVKNGIIVLDSGARLPEGAEVRVDVMSNGEKPKESASPDTVWDDLLNLAGTARDLPENFSRQHDHYIFGTPKR